MKKMQGAIFFLLFDRVIANQRAIVSRHFFKMLTMAAIEQINGRIWFCILSTATKAVQMAANLKQPRAVKIFVLLNLIFLQLRYVISREIN